LRHHAHDELLQEIERAKVDLQDVRDDLRSRQQELLAEGA